jgi:hypothetical protein
MTRMRYTQAINETLLAEMERNPDIVLFGEDIELSIFGDTRGALEKFGPSARPRPDAASSSTCSSPTSSIRRWTRSGTRCRASS